MIRITIDLVPHSNPLNRRRLGSATICNDGTGTRGRGHYSYTLYGKSGRVMRTGYVRNFPRKALHAWQLVRWVLRSAFDE